MPQIHQVLSCFQCGTFQVQLVKKKPKWECKICREKQSTKKIFMQSENPKDCRLMVQEMNLHRTTTDDTVKENLEVLTKHFSKSENQHISEVAGDEVSAHTRKSKWRPFLEHNESLTTFKEESDKIKSNEVGISEPFSSKTCDGETIYEFEKRQKWDNLIAETEKCMETKIMTIEKVKCDKNNKTSSLGNKSQTSLTEAIFDDNIDDLNLEI